MSASVDPFVRKLSVFIAFSCGEKEAIDRLRRHCRVYSAGREIILEGQKSQSAFIVASGWACSFKLLPDGQRQIVNFHIPGDILGLRSVLLRKSDHSVEAVTRVEASEVLVADVLACFSEAPRLACAVLWAAAREEATVAEHLVDVGRRSADARVAHFLLELGARLKLVGKGDDAGFCCPLTQHDLADALGLSPVHVNRVLRQLRERNLVTFRKELVRFDDLQGLMELADFVPDYLDQEGPLI